MNDFNGQWTISQDEEYFNECEYFDTKEEAINFGKSYEDFDGIGFYVGQIEAIPMYTDFLGDHCIEHIQEHHFNNDGEFGQEYLDDVKKEHLVELDEIIKNAVLDWATKYNYHPRHFFVRSVEYIESEGE